MTVSSSFERVPGGLDCFDNRVDCQRILVPGTQAQRYQLSSAGLQGVSFEVVSTYSQGANQGPQQKVKNDEASYKGHIVHLLRSTGSNSSLTRISLPGVGML